MNDIIVENALLLSTIECPSCNDRSAVPMPGNACVIVWVCPGCSVELRPKPGDCCVFCSYGTTRCPPFQQEHAQNEE